MHTKSVPRGDTAGFVASRWQPPWRYRVGMVLSVLAFVPLLGLAYLTSAKLSESNDLRQAAEAAPTSTRRLIALTELSASVTDEATRVGVLTAIRDLELPPSIVETEADLDAEAEFASCIWTS